MAEDTEGGPLGKIDQLVRSDSEMNLEGYSVPCWTGRRHFRRVSRVMLPTAAIGTSTSLANSADASVVDAAASEDFRQAELDSTILKQIGDALRRIEDGTYGRCLIDDQTIERKRLDAVPWAAYCIKHQALLEAASRPKPTL